MSTDSSTSQDVPFDISVLSIEEKEDLSNHIDNLINQYKGNRQAVNRLVFESVSAMTEGEEGQRKLAAKKGLKRLISNLTGSNKSLQDKINENFSVTQYASQQIIHRLAEQNEMSFDLIAAINNKLNASLVATGEEFSKAYDYMERILKKTRSDMVKLEYKVEKLEQNVNLLNWENTIEYQEFNGVEYENLSVPELLVCFARDFCDITKGNWDTSDLLLLKKAMDQTAVSSKDKCNYFEFIKAVNSSEQLKSKLLGGKIVEKQPDVSYLTMLGTMRKLELVETDEHYIVDTVKSMLGSGVSEKEIEENITKNFLLQEGLNIDCEVNNFDLLMELIYSIRQAEEEGLFSKKKIENLEETINEQVKEEVLFPKNEQNYAKTNTDEYASEIKGKTREELVKLAYQYASGEEQCENIEKAWAFYKAADIKNASPVIWDYTKKIFVKSDLLIRLLKFGLERHDALAECIMGVCYYFGFGVKKDLPKSVVFYQKAAEQGNAMAQHWLGICYRDGKGVEMNPEKAVEWYQRAAEQGLAIAYCNLGFCYKNGYGVEKNLEKFQECFYKGKELLDARRGV